MRKNITLTAEDLAIHRQAVKLRKLTDKQLIEAFETANKKLEAFLTALENDDCNTLDPTVVKYIREYAVKNNLL